MIPLAEVLRRHWPAYQRQFGPAILPSHRRAVQCLLACRTPQLGGELYRCPNCRQDHYVYHSCHHRACPQCGHAAATAWLARQKLKLLPLPYYLLTFTVPEGLRPWLRSHQHLGYGLLLQQSAAALQEVAGRAKYLGGELGFLSVLHTWGRQLQFHPHVHCVVPAGGLRRDGLRWLRPPAPDYFLPQPVLAARWRNRLRDLLRREHPAQFQQIPAHVWRQAWVVDVQPAGGGEPALKYLSAYVYRTALGSERILADEGGSITFRYKDSQDRQWHTLSLAAMEFIRRYLQHVLPRGFQRVRYYGWLSAAAKHTWARILALLDWKPPQPPESQGPLVPRCPKCGAPLNWVQTLARGPP